MDYPEWSDPDFWEVLKRYIFVSIRAAQMKSVADICKVDTLKTHHTAKQFGQIINPTKTAIAVIILYDGVLRSQKNHPIIRCLTACNRMITG